MARRSENVVLAAPLLHRSRKPTPGATRWPASGERVIRLGSLKQIRTQTRLGLRNTKRAKG